MELKVTSIGFRPDRTRKRKLTNEEEQELREQVLAKTWEADSDRELMFKIFKETGWHVGSIQYEHV